MRATTYLLAVKRAEKEEPRRAARKSGTTSLTPRHHGGRRRERRRRQRRKRPRATRQIAESLLRMATSRIRPLRDPPLVASSVKGVAGATRWARILWSLVSSSSVISPSIFPQSRSPSPGNSNPVSRA